MSYQVRESEFAKFASKIKNLKRGINVDMEYVEKKWKDADSVLRDKERGHNRLHWPMYWDDEEVVGLDGGDET